MTKNLSIAMDQMDLRFLQLRSPTALAIRNMAHSMEKRGQLTPVVLVGEEKPYILIDGFKRYWAGQSLGLESLKAILIDVDLTKAKSMMYLMNRTVRLSFIQEAMLIRELVDQDGLKQTEVAELLDHHKSWVNRRLMIIRRLAPEILEDLRMELLPPGAVAVLARVALCNQGDFSAAIQRHGLCLKDIHLLTDIWCKTKEPEKKQFLLRSPKEALALVNEEQTGLSALQKIRKILLVFKKRLDTPFQYPDSNVQLKSCLTQIKSEIHTIEKNLEEQ
jgi:ParB/RepB/Spo0J family partition protein